RQVGFPSGKHEASKTSPAFRRLRSVYEICISNSSKTGHRLVENKSLLSGGKMGRDISIRFSTIVGSALALVVLVVPLAQAQVTWNVSLGSQSPDASKQAMAFLPNELWIYKGDSITWTSKTDEIHTVSFLKQAASGASLAGTARPAFPLGCTGGGQGGATPAT